MTEPTPAVQTTSQQDISKKQEPLTVLSYMVTMVVLLIPIIGPIMALIWSFSGRTNINRRNYARAILILGLIGIVILGILYYYAQTMILPMLDEVEVMLPLTRV